MGVRRWLIKFIDAGVKGPPTFRSSGQRALRFATKFKTAKALGLSLVPPTLLARADSGHDAYRHLQVLPFEKVVAPG